VLSRYHELRPTVFSVASLQQRFVDAYESMRRCGALQREERRWSGDSDIAGLDLNFSEELEYIKQWIAQRMEFLDQSFATLAIEELRPEPAADRCYDLLGRPARPGKGLLLHRGRKTLVR
jgi:hypothetical protein